MIDAKERRRARKAVVYALVEVEAAKVRGSETGITLASDALHAACEDYNTLTNR